LLRTGPEKKRNLKKEGEAGRSGHDGPNAFEKDVLSARRFMLGGGKGQGHEEKKTRYFCVSRRSV